MILLGLVLGAVFLYLGAEALVWGSSKLALKWGIAPFIIAITIVAFGTSAPEFMSSLLAQIYGAKGNLAMGDIIGSNISNIVFCLGIAAVLKPFKIDQRLYQGDFLFLMLATGLLSVFMLFGGIGRGQGLSLLLVLIFSIYYQFYKIKKKWKKARSQQSEVKRKKKLFGSMWAQICLVVIGIGLLSWGGQLLIRNSVRVVQEAGISERFIGLTIVALGTGLPEFVTSIVATLRGKHDIALGDIIGSNIFNICLGIGLVSIIEPISFSPYFLQLDLPVMVLSSLLLWYISWKKTCFTRFSGALFLSIYISYLFIIWKLR